MASKHSGVQPISNISDLIGLGRTSSITLPKKRYWKYYAAGFAALFVAGGFGYFLSASQILTHAFGEAPQVVEASVEQMVPIAPNPEIMPPDPKVGEAAPEIPLVLAPAVLETKTAIADAPFAKKKAITNKIGKRTLVKAKPKAKKALAKAPGKKSKVVLKAHKAKAKMSQNVASKK